MTTERKIAAALGLAAIAGVTIALREATVSEGAVLGLSPVAAVVLVAGVAFAVPKLLESR